MDSWSNRFLSQAERGVMIRAVAQAIPSYLMHCFKLPTTLLHELEQIFARFWWGGRRSKRKVQWRHWLALCCSKLDGRVRFKDLKSFNSALLARRWWNLLQHPNSLCFRSLHEGRRVVEYGSSWRVGNGCSIDAWTDKWIKKEPTFRPNPLEATDTPLRVSSLITNERTWDVAAIHNLFQPADAECILKLPLSRNPMPHSLIWNESVNGDMSAKVAYAMARTILGKALPDRTQRKSCWKIIWAAKVVPKIKLFFWRTVQGILPIVVNLSSRNLHVDSSCCICGGVGENRNTCFHQSYCKSPESIVARARNQRDDFFVATTPPVRSNLRRDAGWVPPPEGTFNINVDAGFQTLVQRATLAAIIRNHSRRFC
ncbi:hypothetical protein PTKIN_Ptkin06aG0202400 [Pterospermum kingtungense]